jgi:hypothetical protein
MAEILAFTGITKLPDDPAVALDKAKAWDMERVVICGWTHTGKFVFGGSHSEVGEALLLLEICKRQIMAVAEEQAC